MIVAALVLFGLLQTTAPAGSLPSGKWSVGNEETTCVARRTFGDPANVQDLAIAVSPIYRTVRISVLGSTPSTKGSGEGSVGFDDGTSLRVPFGHVSTGGRFETWYSTDIAVLQEMAGAPTMTLNSNDAPVTLRLAGGNAMVAALRGCADRLAASWGGEPGAPSAIGQAEPITGNPAAWFGSKEYPASARKAGVTGFSVVVLAIGKDGVPIKCSTIRSAGNADLDAATCAIASRRLRTKPPVDASGKPAFGWYILPVRWTL